VSSVIFDICLLFDSFILILAVELLWFQIAAAKDADAAFFKKLDGFQPCEISELKAGTHVFGVYGQFSDFSCCLGYYALIIYVRMG
jgi:hypothetical protein